MSDAILSTIRTAVPAAVGALITWLASIGLDLGDNARVGLITAGTALVTTLYYVIVRWLESKWPAIGVLLGAPVQPTYNADTGSTDLADGADDANDEALDPTEASQYVNNTVIQDTGEDVPDATPAVPDTTATTPTDGAA